MANRPDRFTGAEGQVIRFQYARSRDDGQRGVGADGNAVQLDGLHPPRVPPSDLWSRFGGVLRIVPAGVAGNDASHLVDRSLGSSFVD